jgi:hypothetical protein
VVQFLPQTKDLRVSLNRFYEGTDFYHKRTGKSAGRGRDLEASNYTGVNLYIITYLNYFYDFL